MTLNGCPFCDFPVDYTTMSVVQAKGPNGKDGIQAVCGNCLSRGPWVEGSIENIGNALIAWDQHMKLPKSLEDTKKWLIEFYNKAKRSGDASVYTLHPSVKQYILEQS
jgi:hypothetical protein